MIDRATKLRFRRRYRRSRRQVEDIGLHAEEGLEKNFFKRLSRLVEVRRFVAAWLVLIILLIGGVGLQTRALGSYYQELKPAPGGSFTEGFIGSFTNANPVYASGSVDSAISRLLFAGLFKYDQSNQLVGDLAEKYSVDEKGLVYTVTLRDGLKWQDGMSLTADDVVFTYTVIQNPDAKSPLQTSWQGIKVAALDLRTVTFTLPNALSAFPYSMVNGIIPKHLLQNVVASQLRSVSFNSFSPVGAGPFRLETVEVNGTITTERTQRIALLPNPHYYAGVPKLSRYLIRTFNSEEQLQASLGRHELNAAVGLDSIPEQVKSDPAIKEIGVPLTSGVYVFFKNTHEVLGDVRVRQALVRAVKTNMIIDGLGYPALPVRGPLLKSHVGYVTELTQLDQDITEANRLLDVAGWVKGVDGMRKNGDRPLVFRLFSQSTSEYAYITQVLQKQWLPIGARVDVFLQPDSDLQTTIALHNYDALLYGISLGVDPDVFAYWHSSQADIKLKNRPNFSEYHSVQADKALEAGRTRADPTLRVIKYRPFLEAWRNDAPALGLYQPRFLYILRGQLFGFEPKVFNASTDRYSNVHNWMVRQEKVNK